MTAPASLSLLIGCGNSAEFALVRESLAAVGQVQECDNCEAAVEWAAKMQAGVDWIVVCQSRPGRWSHRTLENLQRINPLVRPIVVLGSWCEGETRTGSPVPGMVRIAWYQWAVRAERIFGQRSAGDSTVCDQPATMSSPHRWLNSPNRFESEHCSANTIGILTSFWTTADAIAGAVGAAGYQGRWLRSETDLVRHAPAAVIWSGGQLEPAEQRELGHWTRRLPGTPVLALLDYPREQDRTTALACGACEVLGKPLLIDDLAGWLAKVVATEAQILPAA